jgi:phosphoribosylformylglycinamidine synthase
VQARIHVTLKSGVLDPQGKAVQHALEGLGFAGVEDVRQGKVIDLTIAETDETAVRADLTRMCETLLANTVIEDYQIAIGPIVTSEGSAAS